MAYKNLIKVSNVCQLLDKSKYPAIQTINGVTFTNNGDGSITVNGTATSGSGFRFVNLNAFYIEGNRTYLMTGCPEGGSPNKYFMYDGYSKLGSDLGGGVIKTVSDRTLCSPVLHIVTGQTVSNLVFKPQLFDLTEMYGAGNEPTTVEQFRQDFPDEMYDYSPHCWLTSYKRVFMTGGGNYLTSYQRNLTCKTKNLWTCNKTYNFYTYDKSTQVFTIFGTGLGSCYTLPTPISAGETFTISVYCLSGEIPSESTVVIGGYHFGEKSIWQTEVTLPVGNVGGKVYYRTATTTDTLTDFLIFVYQSGPTNLKVRIQFERGSTATDYVHYGHL